MSRDARRKRKRTRHHRKARFFGGTRRNNNISFVDSHIHQSFHSVFGPGDPGEIVRRLNSTWVDQDAVILTVPTEKIREVLAALRSVGVFLGEEELGLSLGHYDRIPLLLEAA